MGDELTLRNVLDWALKAQDDGKVVTRFTVAQVAKNLDYFADGSGIQRGLDELAKRGYGRLMATTPFPAYSFHHNGRPDPSLNKPVPENDAEPRGTWNFHQQIEPAPFQPTAPKEYKQNVPEPTPPKPKKPKPKTPEPPEKEEDITAKKWSDTIPYTWLRETVGDDQTDWIYRIEESRTRILQKKPQKGKRGSWRFQ